MAKHDEPGLTKGNNVLDQGQWWSRVTQIFTLKPLGAAMWAGYALIHSTYLVKIKDLGSFAQWIYHHSCFGKLWANTPYPYVPMVNIPRPN